MQQGQRTAATRPYRLAPEAWAVLYEEYARKRVQQPDMKRIVWAAGVLMVLFKQWPVLFWPHSKAPAEFIA